MQENVLETIDKEALGIRLQQARLNRGLSLIDVEKQAGSPVLHLASVEQGLIGCFGPHELITLAHLYGVQLYQLLNPLPEGLTREDILGMYCRCEISEEVACHELGVDLLDLRILVKQYRERVILEAAEQHDDRLQDLLQAAIERMDDDESNHLLDKVHQVQKESLRDIRGWKGEDEEETS